MPQHSKAVHFVFPAPTHTEDGAYEADEYLQKSRGGLFQSRKGVQGAVGREHWVCKLLYSYMHLQFAFSREENIRLNQIVFLLAWWHLLVKLLLLFPTFPALVSERGEESGERDRDRLSIFEAFIVRRSLSHGRGRPVTDPSNTTKPRGECRANRLNTSVTVTLVGLQKCHCSQLSQYPMILSMRSSFLGPKTVTVGDYHGTAVNVTKALCIIFFG